MEREVYRALTLHTVMLLSKPMLQRVCESLIGKWLRPTDVLMCLRLPVRPPLRSVLETPPRVIRQVVKYSTLLHAARGVEMIGWSSMTGVLSPVTNCSHRPAE